MIQLIIGEKGKGKTKVLLEAANKAAEVANGNIVFIDKDNSHMYELKNTIRLINAKDYDVNTKDEFVGFVAGIISADHDLEELFIDRLLPLANIEAADADEVLKKIAKISETNNVKITVSLSVVKSDLSADLADKIVTEL